MKMFVIIALLIFHPLVVACSGADKTLEYKYHNAEKIFRGKIISFKKVVKDNSQFEITHEVTILTNEVFKGNVSLIEKVYTSSSSSSCGVGLDANEKIFFVDNDSYSGMLLGSFQLTVYMSEDGDVGEVGGKGALFNLRRIKNRTPTKIEEKIEKIEDTHP